MTNLNGSCPICDGGVTLPNNTEVSEIIMCSDCNNRLVVKEINEKQIALEEAPQVEEDWGE
jgi:lysine biosynthesis protein LysW